MIQGAGKWSLGDTQKAVFTLVLYDTCQYPRRIGLQTKLKLNSEDTPATTF